MDDNLKIGDYIRGSHRGIHQILSILNHAPDGYSTFDYGKWVITKQVLTSEFTKPRNNKKYKGVLSCCKRITKEDLKQELNEIIDKYHKAMELISSE